MMKLYSKGINVKLKFIQVPAHYFEEQLKTGNKYQFNIISELLIFHNIRTFNQI